MVFTHKPIFVDQPDEGDTGYWSIRPAPRRRLLELFERHGVALVASGHLHRAWTGAHLGTRYIWGPSSGFVVGPMERDMPGDRILGAVIHTLDETVSSEIVGAAGAAALRDRRRDPRGLSAPSAGRGHLVTGLALRRISKAFGGNRILQDVTIEAAPGEFIALVGPSGCGKTTLLRIAAGLEHADTGSVQLGDRDITALRPAARDIAMVFQSYALYPHLTAGQNIAVPLAMRRLSTAQRLPFIGNLMPGQRALRAEIQASVRETAASLRIDHLLDRKPGQMSGGQRQRVALARALVRRPAAFLMDEPLSNLDANLRVHTRGEIVELHRRAGVTTLYVTHDQSEALSMADRVALMIGGRLLQLGHAVPDLCRPGPCRGGAVHRQPAHQPAASGAGRHARRPHRRPGPGRWRRGRARHGGDAGRAAGGAAFPDAGPARPGRRPVRRLEFLGSELLVFLTLADGAELVAKTAPALAAELAPGAAATLAVDAADILVFGPEGGRVPVMPAPLRIAAHG